MPTLNDNAIPARANLRSHLRTIALERSRTYGRTGPSAETDENRLNDRGIGRDLAVAQKRSRARDGPPGGISGPNWA